MSSNILLLFIRFKTGFSPIHRLWKHSQSFAWFKVGNKKRWWWFFFTYGAKLFLRRVVGWSSLWQGILGFSNFLTGIVYYQEGNIVNIYKQTIHPVFFSLYTCRLLLIYIGFTEHVFHTPIDSRFEKQNQLAALRCCGY